ncbi:MAG: hypothetical protein ABEI80_03895 [Haloplanus sp.]
MSAPPTLDTEAAGVDDERRSTDADVLDAALRAYGVTVATRELATAFDALEDLTPAQRRAIARMAGRIAAGVLAPARDATDDADRRAAVRRLFLASEDVRDGT